MTRILTRAKKDREKIKLNDALVTKMGKWVKEGADFCGPIHDRCEENNGYVAGGSQWRAGDVSRQEARERPHMPMNKVISVVNVLSGREIIQRYVPKCYGRSREDSAVAEPIDEFLRWQRDRSETEHEDSMAFRSMVSSGYSCIHKYYDPLEDDGNGLIMDEEVPIWWMIWDSRARKQNLADRRWNMCGRWIAIDEAEAEYADVSPQARATFAKLRDKESLWLESKAAGVPGRAAWDAVANGRWYNRADEEIFMLEAEWRDLKINYKAAIPVNLEALGNMLADPEAYPMPDPEAEPQVDPNTGQPAVDPATGQPLPPPMITLDMLDDEQRMQLISSILEETKAKVFQTKKELDQFMEWYFEVTGMPFEDFIKQKVYSYQYAIMCNDEILETGERKVGFTYEFQTGFPHATRDATTFFGFVDVAKGPQDWRNTFMSLVLTRLATSAKQTLLIEESAVEDVEEFFDQLSNPRGAAVVPDGFVSGNRYMTLDTSSMPPLERELISMADQMVVELAGLSGIDLGQQSDLRRVSGTVVQSVREASNTSLALLFDSLRRYRRRSGRLTLKFMMDVYTPEQISRIVGNEKGQYLADVEEWPDIERFDIKIDEAPTSVTERIEFFDFLTRTGTLEKWVDQERIPFDMVLDWNPWMSEADKIKIRKWTQDRDAAAQAQEQLQTLTDFLQQTPEGQQMLEQSGVQPPEAPAEQPAA